MVHGRDTRWRSPQPAIKLWTRTGGRHWHHLMNAAGNKHKSFNKTDLSTLTFTKSLNKNLKFFSDANKKDSWTNSCPYDNIYWPPRNGNDCQTPGGQNKDSSQYSNLTTEFLCFITCRFQLTCFAIAPARPHHGLGLVHHLVDNWTQNAPFCSYYSRTQASLLENFGNVLTVWMN